VAALLWYLARTGPSTNQLPELRGQVTPCSKIGAWLAVSGIALLFVLNIVSADGRDLLTLLSLAASVAIIMVWRRDISRRMVIQSFTFAILAYLAGSLWVNMGVISESLIMILSVFTVLFYAAGGLLLKRTKLGGAQLLSGQYRDALKSVLFGCLLFIPLGLINALDGSSVDLSSVSEWWT
jgi:hypothetical protein